MPRHIRFEIHADNAEGAIAYRRERVPPVGCLVYPKDAQGSTFGTLRAGASAK
ncbi:MAG TPA: hypothetical protein VMU96_08370 [Casimicrobiaceae bacterium]|nr:hypothetical protein [Casimicrobiaceae bacterium]